MSKKSISNVNRPKSHASELFQTLLELNKVLEVSPDLLHHEPLEVSEHMPFSTISYYRIYIYIFT